MGFLTRIQAADENAEVGDGVMDTKEAKIRGRRPAFAQASTVAEAAADKPAGR
jgi:hypothetical protein